VVSIFVMMATNFLFLSNASEEVLIQINISQNSIVKNHGPKNIPAIPPGNYRKWGKCSARNSDIFGYLLTTGGAKDVWGAMCGESNGVKLALKLRSKEPVI
jgi:hypothetical protein